MLVLVLACSGARIDGVMGVLVRIGGAVLEPLLVWLLALLF